MTTLSLTPASKPVRSSTSLAGQQYRPYLPDLAPSDFHLFGPPKVSLRHFSSNEEVKVAVKKWLKTQPVEFYNKGYLHSLKARKRRFGKWEIT